MDPELRRLIDLSAQFERLNEKHFNGFLDEPYLKWNTRLRSSAGRFIPGRRSLWDELPPVIEVAKYLLEEPNREELILDTLAHEMIHFWLWVRRRPYGHTPEFWTKMTEMGVSRYNPVPRTRPYRYVYKCPSCLGEYKARRKLGPLACAKCCKRHAGGKYDIRFKLYFEKAYEAVKAESPLLSTSCPSSD